MHPIVYRDIVKHFLDGNMSAKEFETTYLTIRHFQGFMVEPLYEILNEVFWSVEDFWEECTPEQEEKEQWVITETTMRKQVAASFAKLEEFLNTYKGDYWTETPQEYLEHVKQVEERIREMDRKFEAENTAY